MSAYNLCLIFANIAHVLLYSFRDQLQPVSTGFLWFFVLVHSSCILKLSGTGPYIQVDAGVSCALAVVGEPLCFLNQLKVKSRTRTATVAAYKKNCDEQ